MDKRVSNRRPVKLSRRTLISAACAAAPAVIITAAAGAAAAQTPRKLAQRAVAYQPTPHGDQRCDNCTLFEPPDACRSVVGPVAPEGWCRIYVRARAPAAPAS